MTLYEQALCGKEKHHFNRKSQKLIITNDLNTELCINSFSEKKDVKKKLLDLLHQHIM